MPPTVTSIQARPTSSHDTAQPDLAMTAASAHDALLEQERGADALAGVAPGRRGAGVGRHAAGAEAGEQPAAQRHAGRGDRLDRRP